MTTETPTKLVVDCSTGEQAIVPLTVDEITNLETARLAAEEEKAAAEAAAAVVAAAKASAEAKLASLGLTADEIAALTK